MKEFAVFVATTFIKRFGKLLLAKYSCEKEPQTSTDRYAVAVKRLIVLGGSLELLPMTVLTTDVPLLMHGGTIKLHMLKMF